MPNGGCGCCGGNNYSMCCYSSPKCCKMPCCPQYCCPMQSCCMPMTCCYSISNNRGCCGGSGGCCGGN